MDITAMVNHRLRDATSNLLMGLVDRAVRRWALNLGTCGNMGNMEIHLLRIPGDTARHHQEACIHNVEVLVVLP